MTTREKVELRAYRIWQEAGCPEGSSLAHWFQAELELGVVSEDETENALARLDDVAAAAKADDRLQAAVDASLPKSERLPGGADENPLSEHVKEIAEGQRSQPGATTFEGGDRVERSNKKGEPQPGRSRFSASGRYF
jgi:hypothetical protein